MDTNEKNSVLNFISCCNEFINGKFLFASAKLVSILDEIDASAPLKDLFSQCEQGFDYSLESTKDLIKMPTKAGYFTKPEELDKFLALVHNILLDMKSEKIDYNIFVNKYFSNDEKVPPTQKFLKDVMIPFRDTVAKYFEVDENNSQHFVLTQFAEKPVEEQKPVEEENIADSAKEEEKEFDLTPIFEDINEIATNMIATYKENLKIKDEQKKDALFVLSELLKASNEKDIERAYALIVGLKYITLKEKCVKHLMEELMFVVRQLENA